MKMRGSIPLLRVIIRLSAALRVDKILQDIEIHLSVTNPVMTTPQVFGIPALEIQPVLTTALVGVIQWLVTHLVLQQSMVYTIPLSETTQVGIIIERIHYQEREVTIPIWVLMQAFQIVKGTET